MGYVGAASNLDHFHGFRDSQLAERFPVERPPELMRAAQKGGPFCITEREICLLRGQQASTPH